MGDDEPRGHDRSGVFGTSQPVSFPADSCDPAGRFRLASSQAPPFKSKSEQSSSPAPSRPVLRSVPSGTCRGGSQPAALLVIAIFDLVTVTVRLLLYLVCCRCLTAMIYSIRRVYVQYAVDPCQGRFTPYAWLCLHYRSWCRYSNALTFAPSAMLKLSPSSKMNSAAFRAAPVSKNQLQPVPDINCREFHILPLVVGILQIMPIAAPSSFILQASSSSR